MRFNVLFVLLCPVILSADAIDNLAPRTWYEIPNSHMEAVCPSSSPGGCCGCAAIYNAWNGGAFDTRRDRLIIWGGGHGDYAGNEIYVFDMTTLAWSRLTDPAPDVTPSVATGEYPVWNGNIQPVSRHTYNYITYLASMDRFMSFGFAAPYPAGGPGGDKCHSFNFDTKKWERRLPAPGWGLDALSAYDPVTGHGWVKGTDSHSYLAEFMPDSGAYGTWVRRSTDASDFMYKYSLTMDIDPVSRKLVAAGGGEVYFWDITSPSANMTHSLVTTSGGSAVTGTNDPGLAYDPVSKEIIGWASGQSVYGLNVNTRAWTQYNGSGANPGSPQGNGTYGRFRYSPGRNVFVIANGHDRNVFVYRHTAGNSLEQARFLRSDKGMLTACPNPFSGYTTFSLSRTLPWTGLFIYDLAGKRVAELKTPRFEPKNMPTGIYNAVCRNAGKTLTTRIVRVK